MNQMASLTPRESASGPTKWVSHPTSRVPGTLYNANPEERLDSLALSGEATAAVRRRRRIVRESPLVPWPYLITCVSALAVLIVMLLVQRAQVVKSQYTLVDLKQARAQALNERAEIRLAIQRLSALERVDGRSRRGLRMVRPARRLVLDLSIAGAAQTAEPATVGILAAKRSDRQTH